jgi:hypothetical protein
MEECIDDVSSWGGAEAALTALLDEEDLRCTAMDCGGDTSGNDDDRLMGRARGGGGSVGLLCSGSMREG